MDQSPQKNHLGQRHKLVNASEHKITVGDGVEVYGMYFDKGYGYHVDATTGIATGNDPESIYAVLSGTHFNGGCCFDCQCHSVPPATDHRLDRSIVLQQCSPGGEGMRG